jgi:cellulose synthase/poly-beta-1,6-N-acetylglucosamine synthase-like glycosyltransferase
MAIQIFKIAIKLLLINVMLCTLFSTLYDVGEAVSFAKFLVRLLHYLGFYAYISFFMFFSMGIYFISGFIIVLINLNPLKISCFNFLASILCLVSLYSTLFGLSHFYDMANFILEVYSGGRTGPVECISYFLSTYLVIDSYYHKKEHIDK